MKKTISVASVLLLLLTVSACTAVPESDRADLQQSVTEAKTESRAMTEQPEESPAEDFNLTEQEETTMRISVKSEQYEIIYELNDSTAANELYAQLPLTTEVEPFSNNEMTFYPEKLDVTNTPLSDGETGSLSYYEPWGDVVMFYAPCTPNSSLYELGTVVSGAEHIKNLSGSITVSAVEERSGL